MNKLLVVYVFLFLSVHIFAQSHKNQQHRVLKDGKYKIEYQGKSYDIDNQIITIKVSDEEKIDKQYKIIRNNKLGYFDIEIPKNYSFDAYLLLLEKDEAIQEIEYNVIGEYLNIIPNDMQLQQQWYLYAIKMYQVWNFNLNL